MGPCGPVRRAPGFALSALRAGRAAVALRALIAPVGPWSAGRTPARSGPAGRPVRPAAPAGPWAAPACRRPRPVRRLRRRALRACRALSAGGTLSAGCARRRRTGRAPVPAGPWGRPSMSAVVDPTVVETQLSLRSAFVHFFVLETMRSSAGLLVDAAVERLRLRLGGGRQAGGGTCQQSGGEDRQGSENDQGATHQEFLHRSEQPGNDVRTYRRIRRNCPEMDELSSLSAPRRRRPADQASRATSPSSARAITRRWISLVPS